MRTSRRQHWTPAHREESIYRYVSFDVGPGVSGVGVSIVHGKGAVIDLGVFDPDGFRGYSGGARKSFAITPLDATPGYLPGELPAGEWRVMLGLYIVPEEGVAVDVFITTEGVEMPPFPASPEPTERPPARRLPAEAGRRWMAGDLHAHTVHSDGALTVDELACRAAGRGLDFLAVTDHNTVSHHPHLPVAARRYGLRLIPGQEVTTHEGHANALGAIPWVDFRRSADDWLDHTAAADGLLSINHPVDLFCGWQRDFRATAPLVETWHKTWDRRSSNPLDWCARHGAVAIGGSDFHDPRQGDVVGSPTTFVEVEADDVLRGVSEGRVAISADPAGPVVLRRGDEVVVVEGEGAILVAPDGRPTPVTGNLVGIVVTEVGICRLVDPDGRTLALAA